MWGLKGCLTRGNVKIRPHRFGGEGVLIGGQNSNTKCSMTFVNIAVAISALAGGGQKRFRTETRIRWCFRHFSRIFGCLSARGYWNGILGHFGSFPAMEKRPKMKKTLYIARFCRVFGCQSIENTAKTSVLDWRYSKKRVNYRMLDWNITKTLSKAMFWKDLLPLWQKTCKLPSVWLETLEKHCQKQCFGRISYIYVGVGYRHWHMEKLKKTL